MEWGPGSFADMWADIKEWAKMAEENGIPLPGDDGFETLLREYGMGSAIDEIHKTSDNNPAKKIFWNLEIWENLMERIRNDRGDEKE